jgi:hypothetical protein
MSRPPGEGNPGLRSNLRIEQPRRLTRPHDHDPAGMLLVTDEVDNGSCDLLWFERIGRPNRTQEVAGSNPASSIQRTLALAGVFILFATVGR